MDGRILGPGLLQFKEFCFYSVRIHSLHCPKCVGNNHLFTCAGLLLVGSATNNSGLIQLGVNIILPGTGFTLAVLILIFMIAITAFGTRIYTSINRFAFSVLHAIILALFLIALDDNI